MKKTDKQKIDEVEKVLDGVKDFYDPPEGWKYGFPKEYKPLPGESIEDTLRRDGYPEHLMKLAGHCRFWSATLIRST